MSRDWVELLRDEELLVLRDALVRQALLSDMSRYDQVEIAKRLLVDISEEMSGRRSKALGQQPSKGLDRGSYV